MSPVFRFAPSPNGYLHLGHAYSALLNFDRAQAGGSRLLLRIEDIDPTRCKPEYEDAIFEDLAWLGIVWERPVRRQSEHLEDYRAALAQLSERGLVYPSFESRAEIAKLVAAQVETIKKENPDVDLRLIDSSVTVTLSNYDAAIETLIEGAVLAVLVVFLFLRDWRSVIVVVLNIPFALLGSIIALWLTGQTVNIMTLGGLALAVGILVD